MNENLLLKITSALSVLLFSLHWAHDIVLGTEPGTLSNYPGVLILAVWLYAALALAGKRSGNAILLLASLLGAGVPVLHMMGKGVGQLSRSPKSLFFVWTLLALGATALVSLFLAARGLWRLRRAGPR